METTLTPEQLAVHEYLQNQNRPMTSPKAAEYLGVTLSTLYKYCHYNKIPFYKPTGRKNYFLKADLDNWLMGHRIKSGEELDQEATRRVLKGGRK